MSKMASASGDVWRRTIRVPCQAALSIYCLAEADKHKSDRAKANEPGQVVSIEPLLLAKALESGADGELVNRRWLDGSSMCLRGRHCRL
jgi:hypothetical protein